MNFFVLSRDEAELGVGLSTPYVVISITDPDSPPPQIPAPPACRDLLTLRFHDVEPLDAFGFPPGLKIMDVDQARAVWAFANKHRSEVEAVVIHCEQGMSRSPAVAAALARGWGYDETRFFRAHDPNRHVYQLLRETEEAEPEDSAEA